MGNSIQPQPSAQLGGIAAVYFVEQQLVRRWPLTNGGKLRTGHTLADLASFAQLHGTIYAEALSTDGTDTPHGAQFAHLLEGFYAGDDPKAISQFERMQGKRYLVLARYHDGRVVAAGNQLGGLLFTSKYTSGQRPRERKGYAWKFEGATSTAAVYLSAPFVVEDQGTIEPSTGTTPTPVPGGDTGTTPTPGTTPSPGSNLVKVYNRRGKLMATLSPGDKLTITSSFRVTLKVN